MRATLQFLGAYLVTAILKPKYLRQRARINGGAAVSFR
jgi:hypothetical protein